MRGLPGSGKTHLANLFKQLEIKHFGNTPRIISVDDYFMEEKEVVEVDPATSKNTKTIKMEYTYDADLFEVAEAARLHYAQLLIVPFFIISRTKPVR